MSDSRDEPEETPADRSGTEEIEYCAHCGAKLPADVWCPLRTDLDTDGNVRVRSFCDESCKDAWVVAHPQTDGRTEDP